MVVVGGGAAPLPLGKETAFALSPDRLYIGTADSAVVHTYALDGRRIGRVGLTTGIRPAATPEDERRALDAALESVPPAAASRVKAILQQVPRPSQLPPYRQLWVDDRGHLWIQRSAQGAPTMTLDVYDPRGQPAGEVALRIAKVFAIHGGHIVGSRDGADGEMHIVAFAYSIR